MPREEYIRIFRSDVAGTNPPSLTSGEIAVNMGDGRFFIGGTNGSVITYFPGGVTSFNGLTGIVSLTGDGAAVRGRDNSFITTRLADNALTGIASFNADQFSVGSTGHVRSKGVITINSQPPDSNGNFTIASATVVTGDGGAVLGRDNAFITTRLADNSLTGVASFSSSNFDVAAGAVSLKTGGVPNTALANSSFTLRDEIGAIDTITLGNTLTITGGRGVDFLRTGTDTYQVSGVTATSSVLGVASFNIDNFNISGTGQVKTNPVGIAANSSFNGMNWVLENGKLYEIVGQDGIHTRWNNTLQLAIYNTGITSINGITGSVTLTGDGSAIRGYDNNKFTAILASQTATGVASFNTNDLVVTTTGHVSLTGTVARTNTAQTFTAFQRFASGISADQMWIGPGVTSIEIANRNLAEDESGPGRRVSLVKTDDKNGLLLLSTNGASADSSIQLNGSGIIIGHKALTGGGPTLEITPEVLNDNGATPVAPNTFSYRSRIILRSGERDALSTGYMTVNLRAPDAKPNGQNETFTLDLPAGDGVLAVTRNTVVSINGLTGVVNLTGDGGSSLVLGNNRISNRLASTSATGVASFNVDQFSVGSTGHVSLTGTIALTDKTNIFTAPQDFQGGFTATYANFQFGLGTPFIYSIDGTTAGRITIDDYAAATSWTTPVRSSIRLSHRPSSEDTYWSSIKTGVITQDQEILTPNDSGTIALTKNTVASFNGATGSVTLTGDGGAIRGVDNSYVTARFAGTSTTGVASFSSANFAISLTGQVSIKTGSITPTQLESPSFFIRDENGNSQTLSLGQSYSITGGNGIDTTTQSGGLLIANTGVLSLNGLNGSIALTGDNNAVIGADNNKFTIRQASTTGQTGVASFSPADFTVSATGQVKLLTPTNFSFTIRDEMMTTDTINLGDTLTITGGTGIDVIRTAADTLRITALVASTSVTGIASFNADQFSVGSTGHVRLSSSIAFDNEVVSSINGLTGARTLTGDGKAIRGGNNNTITALTGGCGFTGVVGVDCAKFTINQNGIITGLVSQGSGCDPNNPPTTQAACLACGGQWFAIPGGGGSCQLGFAPLNSGLGISAAADGSIAYFYLDVNNLSSYTGEFTTKTTPRVVMFDPDEAGFIRSKSVSIQDLFVKNYNVFESKTPNQLASPNKKTSNDKIEFEIVTGLVAQGDQGLVKGASAHEYITNNTISAINGCTGGTFSITGTTQEVTVSTGTNCRQIVIGLPDHISLSSLSATGATFSGRIAAGTGSSIGGIVFSTTGIAQQVATVTFPSYGSITNPFAYFVAGKDTIGTPTMFCFGPTANNSGYGSWLQVSYNVVSSNVDFSSNQRAVFYSPNSTNPQNSPIVIQSNDDGVTPGDQTAFHIMGSQSDTPYYTIDNFGAIKSATGATFDGNVFAKKFKGSFDGGTF